MKKKARIRLLGIILGGLLVFITTATIGSAQEWSRKGKGEIFVLGQQMSGDTTTSLGIEIEVDDTTVGGLGMGYNFNDYLNLNWDMFFGSTDLAAKSYGVSLKGDTDLFGMDVNLDYNILKSRFTPIVTGGIGFIRFDGTWEGEYSSVSFDETDFSYNLGAGFRWNITDHLLVKGVYRFTWTELEDTDDSILLDGVTLSIGYVF